MLTALARSFDKGAIWRSQVCLPSRSYFATKLSVPPPMAVGLRSPVTEPCDDNAAAHRIDRERIGARGAGAAQELRPLHIAGGIVFGEEHVLGSPD